jgi:hypothetical protein
MKINTQKLKKINNFFFDTYICKKKVMECKYYINEQMKKRKSLNKKSSKYMQLQKNAMEGSMQMGK